MKMDSYLNIRNQISSGDIIFWSVKNEKFSLKNILNWLIQIFTVSEYYHIGIAWVINNRVFVIEAVPPEVRIYPLSKLLPVDIIFCGKDYWNSKIETELLAFVGNKYSKLEALKGYLKTLKIGSNAKWQCAELVAHLFRVSNFGNVDATPTKIYHFLLDKGYHLKRVKNGII